MLSSPSMATTLHPPARGESTGLKALDSPPTGGRRTPAMSTLDTPTTTTFRRGPLAVLLTGTFLIVLDFFVVNVALPSVQRDLHADNTTLEWLVAGYGLTFG